MDMLDMMDLGPQVDPFDLQSWLFEEEYKAEEENFCIGAKENYSVRNGEGCSSPKAITSDDIPGWTVTDMQSWASNLNLVDCVDLQKGVKSPNVSIGNENWSNEFEDQTASLQQIGQSVDVYPTESGASFIVKEEDSRRGSLNHQEELGYGLYGSSPATSERSPRPAYYESEDYIDTETCRELPSFEKPEIIKVPISEAIIQSPKLRVIDVIAQPVVKHEVEDSKIIYCKRVTVPSHPKVILPSPTPPLKDIITEQGDELVRDYVDLIDMKIEPEDWQRSRSGSLECEFTCGLEGTNTRSPKRKASFTAQERKLRKKEQNKQAAIRYREKKKEEHDLFFSSLEKEEEENVRLREQNDKLKAEKEIVARLLLEMLKKKKADSLALKGYLP